MSYWQKQPSSRYLLGQALQYGGTSSVPSTNFGPETFQIRVTSNISGWLAFGPGSTYGTTLAATAQSSGIYIAANVAPEFIAVRLAPWSPLSRRIRRAAASVFAN